MQKIALVKKNTYSFTFFSFEKQYSTGYYKEDIFLKLKSVKKILTKNYFFYYQSKLKIKDETKLFYREM